MSSGPLSAEQFAAAEKMSAKYGSLEYLSKYDDNLVYSMAALLPRFVAELSRVQAANDRVQVALKSPHLRDRIALALHANDCGCTDFSEATPLDREDEEFYYRGADAVLAGLWGAAVTPGEPNG